MGIKSKYAGSCKDGCGMKWRVGDTVFKNDSTEHWCANENCPTPNGQVPVQTIVAPKPKITPEDALKECDSFAEKFVDAADGHFESLAKIYISRMMSNR